ncbi:MAG: hypothetical protein ACC656_06075 [Candidatus Heimdallarchaeota archaeon]
MKKVRLTKINFNQDSDFLQLNSEFDLVENHPNGINIGTIREGVIEEDPKVGECVRITTSPHLGGLFRTSPVVEIIDGGFKTLNSYYKYEILEENFDFDKPVTLTEAFSNLFQDETKEKN